MHWNYRPPGIATAQAFARELGLDSLTAGVLAVRQQTDYDIQGIEAAPSNSVEDAQAIKAVLSNPAEDAQGIEAARLFINPSLARSWSTPWQLAGMEALVDRLQTALQAGKRILVFGDYDVDGITAAAIMLTTLAAFGAQAQVVLPRRDGEGYGLTAAALERVYRLKPEVVLTVDCGISGAPEVADMQSHGIEVLITDHHEPSGLLPQGVALVDPKLDPASPAALLSGAGVALKLAAALGERLGRPELWKGLLDLACLGTLADRMLLTGENRALVAEGLRLMKERPRPGIAAVQAISGRGGHQLTADELAFGLIPRLNAAGRISDPLIALDLLMAQDPTRAEQLALRLEELNKERRLLESSLLDKAEEQVAQMPAQTRSIVAGGDGWHDGVKGIVASRLTRTYGVPALVFSFEDELAIGSGRSVGTIDLHEMVGRLEDMLLRFGGHQAAVGLTIKRERFVEFAQRLEHEMQGLAPERFHPPGEIDLCVGLSQLSINAVDEMSLLEPYGPGNTEPVLSCPELAVRQLRWVGSGEKHLSFEVSNGATQAKVIWFNAPYDSLDEVPSFGELVFQAQVDEWHGRRSLKLKALDLIPPTAATEAPAPLATASSSRAGATLAANAEAPVPLAANAEDPPSLAAAAKVSPPSIAAEAPSSPAAVGAQMSPVANAETLTPYSGTEDLARLSHTLHTGPEQELVAQLARILTQSSGMSLRPAQLKCLETLQASEPTLGIMATGRGKSIIFQVHAARLALRCGQPSLLLYPLRSLINDQEYFLTRALEPLGLRAASLTGATPAHERQRILEALAQRSLHVILSTPEFVFANRTKLPIWQDFCFVVVDEAHHIATSSVDYRPDYTRLESLRMALPRAVFCGFSATSDKPTTQAIVQSLGIRKIVMDTTKRPNLLLQDHRGTTQRDELLASLVASSSKALVYTSTRASTIELTRFLRKALRERAPRIAFYHGRLTARERVAIEQAFRAGEVDCLVATSAFGEGVNIPDIRDVFLYHLPYSLIDFNQMAGRAGRDGAEAHVHLLAQAEDAVWMRASLERGEEPEEAVQPESRAEAAVQETAQQAPREAAQPESRAEAHSSLALLELFADWFFAASADELSSTMQRPLTPQGPHELSQKKPHEPLPKTPREAHQKPHELPQEPHKLTKLADPGVPRAKSKLSREVERGR